jgi:hypothetical protein
VAVELVFTIADFNHIISNQLMTSIDQSESQTAFATGWEAGNQNALAVDTDHDAMTGLLVLRVRHG